MKKIRRFIKFFIILIFLFSTCNPVYGQILNEPKLTNSEAMLVDGKTGRILYKSSESKLYEIGSITKLLTVYLTYQAIDEGKIDPQKPLKLSEQAINLSQDYDVSNVPLRVDFDYYPDELIESVAVSLANGSTLAIAEAVSGSEEEFVKLMNQQMDEWGLAGQYKFYNATGLPTGYKPFEPDTIESGSINQMTAEAVSVVAYHLVNEYPQYLDYSSQAKAYFKPETNDKFEMLNYNLLVPGRPYSYEHANGLMSATSRRDGASLVASAKKDDLQLVSVILGADLEDGSEYEDSEDLLDFGFNNFSTEKIVSKNQYVTHISRQPVINGVNNWAELIYSSDYYWVGIRGDTALRVIYEYHPDPNYYDDEGNIKAPLKKATQIGRVKIIPRDEAGVKYLPSSKENYVSVQLSSDLDEASWWQSMWNNLSRWGSGIWQAIRKFFIKIFN